MSVWGYILLFVVCATAFILTLAVLSNLAVSWFARRYADKTLDTNLAALEKLLPGKNCGACRCQTCAEYARAVFYGQMDADRCTEGAEELPQQLDACMEKFQKLLEDDPQKEKKRRFR